jgi:hypothetical protein
MSIDGGSALTIFSGEPLIPPPVCTNRRVAW